MRHITIKQRKCEKIMEFCCIFPRQSFHKCDLREASIIKRWTTLTEQYLILHKWLLLVWTERQNLELPACCRLCCGETSTEKMVLSCCGRLCGSLLLILISHCKTCKMPACEDTMRLRLLISALENANTLWNAFSALPLFCTDFKGIFKQEKCNQIRHDITLYHTQIDL